MSENGLRLDKWLFHARFVKQRTLVADLVRRRRIRINDQLTAKVHQAVRPGDVMTLVRPNEVVVLRVLALGTRRGPATEAQGLYEVIERH
ncbi:MAG: RNA-binding S4 domain-containing protein [Geminicoccaceae bacterium]|nr:RNA-binding S4 domain-containing protein [Geminicoccaceae bacterium]MCB2056136.1 RNA-binding S4 domain-containing protein [Geminicoccaceae bacterium]